MAKKLSQGWSEPHSKLLPTIKLYNGCHAESVLSSTYWGREDDLDIEYSLIFQPNASLMLAHCLRHWLNINPTLPHGTSRVW